MNSVIGRGVRNGSAASCTRESHEGRSHTSSTSESKLVAHPVGDFAPFIIAPGTTSRSEEAEQVRISSIFLLSAVNGHRLMFTGP